MREHITLAPYQLEAREWLQTHKQAALWMGMGLGKTASTISALKGLLEIGEIQRALVLAPLRVTNLTWPGEFERWDAFEGIAYGNLREGCGGDIELANYEMMPKLTRELAAGRWDCIVFDEITRLKAHNGKRAAEWLPHLDKVRYRWGLTGTPSPNSLMELWGQLRVLDGGKRLGKTITSYREQYFTQSRYCRHVWTPDPTAMDRIHRKLGDIALPLLSSDYLDIADTVVEDIEIPFPKEAHAAYKELKRELLLILKGETPVVAANMAVLAGKLLQLTSGAVYDSTEEREWHRVHEAKLDAFSDYRDLVDDPVLVACCFRHEQERLVERFGATRFDSATTPKQQVELVQRWNRGEIPILVSDPRSIGHGLNLQAGGRHIVWFTQPWSRELYDQFNARLARRGQTQVPVVTHLLVTGTIDEAIRVSLDDRSSNQSALLQAVKRLHQMS